MNVRLMIHKTIIHNTTLQICTENYSSLLVFDEAYNEPRYRPGTVWGGGARVTTKDNLPISTLPLHVVVDCPPLEISFLEVLIFCNLKLLVLILTIIFCFFSVKCVLKNYIAMEIKFDYFKWIIIQIYLQ